MPFRPPRQFGCLLLHSSTPVGTLLTDSLPSASELGFLQGEIIPLRMVSSQPDAVSIL